MPPAAHPTPRSEGRKDNGQVMTDPLITSPANPRLKAVVALRRRRARDERGATLVDGAEELAIALAAGVRPEVLFWCPELFNADGAQEGVVAQARAAGAEAVRLSRLAFEKIAYREGPDGILAVVPTPRSGLSLPASPRPPLVLVAEGVEKPGNLGAMLRTAEAAGIAAVVAADPVTDWANPNVVRASKGAVFAVPVATATTADLLEWARRRGIRLVVTTPGTDVRYTDVDLTGRVAIVVGAEKHGISPELLAAGQPARIPLRGKVNSLNVAAAAAVVIFEAVRQRG